MKVGERLVVFVWLPAGNEVRRGGWSETVIPIWSTFGAPIKLFTDTTKAFFPSLGNYFCPFRAMGLAGLGLFLLPASSRVGLSVVQRPPLETNCGGNLRKLDLQFPTSEASGNLSFFRPFDKGGLLLPLIHDRSKGSTNLMSVPALIAAL